MMCRSDPTEPNEQPYNGVNNVSAHSSDRAIGSSRMDEVRKNTEEFGSVNSGTCTCLGKDPEHADERLEKMRSTVRTLLECMGEDPNREGLLNTPCALRRHSCS